MPFQMQQLHPDGPLALQQEDIPDGLPDDLVRTLALLDGADRRAAQALIASLPFGSRAALAAYALIEPIGREPDAISPITITPAGWRVIRACADVYTPDEGQEHEWALALNRATERYRQGGFELDGWLRDFGSLSSVPLTTWIRVIIGTLVGGLLVRLRYRHRHKTR